MTDPVPIPFSSFSGVVTGAADDPWIPTTEVEEVFETRFVKVASVATSGMLEAASDNGFTAVGGAGFCYERCEEMGLEHLGESEG